MSPGDEFPLIPFNNPAQVTNPHYAPWTVAMVTTALPSYFRLRHKGDVVPPRSTGLNNASKQEPTTVTMATFILFIYGVFRQILCDLGRDPHDKPSRAKKKKKEL